MSMYVDTRYENFQAIITVKSDTIGQIDLYHPGFRIDFINQFSAASNAVAISELIEKRDKIEKEIADDVAKLETEIAELRMELYYAVKPEDKQTLSQAITAKIEELNTLKAPIIEIEQGKAIECPVCGGTGTVDGHICTNCNGTGTVMTKGINSYVADTSKPMLSITNGNGDCKPDVFCNADDETLIRNGMQYWVNEDKKSMTFRFIPQLNAEYKFQSVVCMLAFDYDNVIRFEVSLMPRLITGDIEKYQKKQPDPVLGQGTWTTTAYDVSAKETVVVSHPAGPSEYVDDDKRIHPEEQFKVGELPRTDFEWNSPIDRDHLYVNNTPVTKESEIVPLYVCKSSAYISQDLNDAGYEFDWSKFKSELYNVGAESAIEIPYTINGTNDHDSITPKTASIKLVETYTGHNNQLTNLNTMNVNYYEIIQEIRSEETKKQISKNQLRCVVAV